MKYNPELDHRRSIRLSQYDYSSAGIYFITLCTHNKIELLGEIENGEMILNEFGKIVDDFINEITNHYDETLIDYYAIMPNHVHMLVIILDDKNEHVGSIHELPNNELSDIVIHDRINRRKMLIPKIVGFLKMNSSKLINITRNTPGESIWQRNYYEHIIRNDKEYYKTRDYIINNPSNWEFDNENKKL